MTAPLFAYGTLMPADPETVRGDGWSPDAVRGWLFDPGPYAALVNLDDPSARWVRGYVRAVTKENHDGEHISEEACFR